MRRFITFARLRRIVIGFIRNALHVLTGTGPCCRFVPTCSEYAAQAIEIHGLLKGTWLFARRLMRCVPGAGFGEDPVPGRYSCTHIPIEGGAGGR